MVEIMLAVLVSTETRLLYRVLGIQLALVYEKAICTTGEKKITRISRPSYDKERLGERNLSILAANRFRFHYSGVTRAEPSKTSVTAVNN
jgi:hypothetical protein